MECESVSISFTFWSLCRLKVKTKAMDIITSLVSPAFEKLKKFLEEVGVI